MFVKLVLYVMFRGCRLQKTLRRHSPLLFNFQAASAPAL